MTDVVVVGGGWFGAQAALKIKKENPNYNVTVLEQNEDIFSEVSGNCGNRLHNGAHYPRDFLTRKSCHKGYKAFSELYPELLTNTSAFYALGKRDAEGNAPKVDTEEFAAVCAEFGNAKELTLADTEYCNVDYIASMEEPTIALNGRLRKFFKEKLQEAKIELHCNYSVKNIENAANGKCVINNEKGESILADYVINATGYQALLPKEPLDEFFRMKIYYQPCVALIYKHNEPVPKKPISFIVMDGAFPSLMPNDDGEKSGFIENYMLTHAKHSMLKRCNTPEEAREIISKIDSDLIEGIKLNCEREINKYFPKFNEKFTFLKSKCVVLAKLETKEDLRVAFTFKKDNTIHIFPGKVSNAIEIGEEVALLIENDQKKIITADNGFSYVKRGTLQCMVTGQGNVTGQENTSSFFKTPKTPRLRVIYPPKVVHVNDEAISQIRSLAK